MAWTSFGSSPLFQRTLCNPCQRGLLPPTHRHTCLPPTAVKEKEADVETEQTERCSSSPTCKIVLVANAGAPCTRCLPKLEE